MAPVDHDERPGGDRVFRFAPSPNGLLHLGHALSALLNHDLARAAGGRLLLRLEDIDRERCREAFAEAILDDLRWLGVAWAGAPRRQSEHFDAYRSALDVLASRGLVYPCFCTRGAVMAASAAKAAAAGVPRPTDPDGAPIYPGTCRDLDPTERARRIAEGRPAALRLDMAAALGRMAWTSPIHPARLPHAMEDGSVGLLPPPEAREAARPGSLLWCECGDGEVARDVPADPAAWGDALLARRDLPTSYHVSVVVDDALQGVTDVVRGRDLFHATGLHRLLQSLLGLPAPRYHHHGLVLDDAGHKLSKSRGAPSLRDLRRDGATPAEIRRRVGLGG